MSEPLTVETKIYFERSRGKSRRAAAEQEKPLPEGHLPRVTKLMALAIKLGRLLDEGVATHAELARLGQVTRARMSQILNLLHLAPDLQERLLSLPMVSKGRAPLRLMDMQAICMIEDWEKQRRLWSRAVILQLTESGTIVSGDRNS
jgi:hypothetical protein